MEVRGRVMPWSMIMLFHVKKWITPFHRNFSESGEVVIILKTKLMSDGDIDVTELHICTNVVVY
jgi:hypothetical protein